MNRACFPKEKHQNSQIWAKFMNFSFWPFLWFGLPVRLVIVGCLNSSFSPCPSTLPLACDLNWTVWRLAAAICFKGTIVRIPFPLVMADVSLCARGFFWRVLPTCGHSEALVEVLLVPLALCGCPHLHNLTPPLFPPPAIR